MRKSSIACLSFGAFLAVASAASAVTCDHSGFGLSMSAAPSDSGHILVVRGKDSLLRFNEWRNSSQTWTGWSILDTTAAHKNTQAPWIQYIAREYQGSGKGQNIYYASSTEFPQWILKRDGAAPTLIEIAYKTSTNLNNAGQTIIGRPTSMQSNTDGEQRLIANVNGTLMSRTWTGTWDGAWTSLGLSGVTGSPYFVQITSNTGALYAKRGSSYYYSYWDGSVWSTWYNYLASSGISGADAAGAYFGKHFVFGYNFSKVPVFRYKDTYSWSSTTPMTGFPGYLSISPVTVANDSALIYGMTASGEIWRVGMKGIKMGTPERFNCLATQSK